VGERGNLGEGGKRRIYSFTAAKERPCISLIGRGGKAIEKRRHFYILSQFWREKKSRTHRVTSNEEEGGKVGSVFRRKGASRLICRGKDTG